MGGKIWYTCALWILLTFGDSSRCCAVIQLCPLGSKEESQNGENSSIEDSENGQDVSPPDVTRPEAVLPRGLTADLSDLVLVPAAWVDHTGQEHEDRCEKNMIYIYFYAQGKNTLKFRKLTYFYNCFIMKYKLSTSVIIINWFDHHIEEKLSLIVLYWNILQRQ